ncbi:hypothetical protein KQX54_007493 [Cotesia glomerata]|uniref:Uncharacterized protein n=1 Tax=Cotesia glomerata TaxID=32391 RepID=A0AAV7I646_COTGL|nr:hypothetical protein KQX54_007493 [Cotesia glomerata]
MLKIISGGRDYAFELRRAKRDREEVEVSNTEKQAPKNEERILLAVEFYEVYLDKISVEGVTKTKRDTKNRHIENHNSLRRGVESGQLCYQLGGVISEMQRPPPSCLNLSDNLEDVEGLYSVSLTLSYSLENRVMATESASSDNDRA